jgi:hypothetical protein
MMKPLALDPRLATELDAFVARLAHLHPYERAWEVEAWGLALTDPVLRAAFAEVWTPSRIAKLGPAELEAMLTELGVREIEEPFAMEKGTDTWAVAEKWRAMIDRDLSAHEELFLGLAATMCWTKRRAEDPSDEMIYDRLVEGELLAAKKSWGAACDCWAFVWESVRGRMPKTQRRAAGVKGLFRGAVIEAWAERYATALVHASRESDAHVERGLAFIDEYLSLFPGTGGTVGWVLQAAKGHFQIVRGRYQEGFSRFEALVREHPQSPAPYRALVEAFLAAKQPPLAISGRALAVTRKAMAAGVDADGRWSLAACVVRLESVPDNLDD